jgi:hypothetical protein
MKKLLMGSIVLTIFAFASLLFQISSCKKADAQPTTIYPIEGLWIGTYASPAVPSQGSLFYSFVIYPDGTLLTKGKGGDGKYYYSSGTWTLSSNNIFSGTIVSFVTPGPHPVTQCITATYSNTGTLTNGTWKDTNNPNGTGLSGTFSTMQRVN